MDTIKIFNQKQSSALLNLVTCQFCHIVDYNPERSRVGYECPVCNTPGNGGLMYYELSTYSLVKLMQEAFNSTLPCSDDENANKPTSTKTNMHNISIVLFFCTLRELLLNNLIDNLFKAQKIQKNIRTRLLKDNRNHSQKQDKLLPSLIGKKWKILVAEENEKVTLDYIKLNKFIEEVVKARNYFMHEGKKYDINHEMAENCVRHTSTLINLFVDLHNSYVHPYYYTNS